MEDLGVRNDSPSLTVLYRNDVAVVASIGLFFYS
jgi:hypothetical protein